MYIWDESAWKNGAIWKGYESRFFEFEGRHACVVSPRNPDGRLAVYTEYFGAFPSAALALLDAGFHIAGICNESRWGGLNDHAARRSFIDGISREYGLNGRAAIIGMSCGGLIGVQFAALYPENVSVLYLDAPVVNLLSTPMAFGRARLSDDIRSECLDALGLSYNDMLVYRTHPYDMLADVIKAKIPAVLVYGEADDCVPYEENGAYIEKAYNGSGVPFLKIAKPGVGHHPHGLGDPSPIVGFIRDNYTV